MKREDGAAFPPNSAVRQRVLGALSAFHGSTVEEVAVFLGRSTAVGVKEVERVLRHLRDRCEAKQDEDGGWRSC